MYISELWPLRSSRHLNRRYGKIFCYDLQHQKEQFDTNFVKIGAYLFCYPCTGLSKSLLTLDLFCRVASDSLRKKSRNMAKFPQNRLKMNTIAKFGRKKQQEIPCKSRKTCNTDFDLDLANEISGKYAPVDIFVPYLWSQEQFDMLHDIIWTFWYFYTHRGCHFKKSPLWRKW